MAKAKTAAEKAADKAAAEAGVTTTQPPVITDDAEAGMDGGDTGLCETDACERPKAGGVLDVVKAFNLKEVNVLLALFEPPFNVSEIWAAGRAVIDLGEKLDGYLNANRLPSFASHQAAATVSSEEIAQQIRAHLKPATTTADGERPRVGANGTLEMDPVLVGLLINLATRALQMFLSRLGK